MTEPEAILTIAPRDRIENPEQRHRLSFKLDSLKHTKQLVT